MAATSCPTTLASSAPGSTRSCKPADGQVVVLRPVRPSDAEPLLALFRRVSAETLRLRFFGCPRLELVEARAMAEVDHVHRDAVVACLGSEDDAP
jgi:hypothetical protein